MRHVYWVGKSRANTFSLWGRRGDRLYCSINSYNMGEGRMIRVWFFWFQDPPWFYLLFYPWVTTLLPLFIFRASSLAPFDTLLMSNYLPISLLRHLGTQSQGKRGDDHSGFFRLYRGVVGLWVPFVCSLSGAFTEGDESPWNDKVACFSIVWVLAREYCQTITWRFVVL